MTRYTVKPKFKSATPFERKPQSKNQSTLGAIKKESKTCFHCRKSGHSLKDCREFKENKMKKSVISELMCYICGESTHTSKNCKSKNADGESTKYGFATCFICKKEGHISSQCEENPNGVYPKGGSCRFCQSVRHLAKDCNVRKNKFQNEFSLKKTEPVEEVIKPKQVVF